MRLSDLTDATADALKSAGAALADLMTPTLRLGVTGLARSGKTVFITALVRSLVAGGRLPFFSAMAEGRITRAYLEPQPDDRVPRFAYEEHLALLAADPPQWPESTRRISQLRVTIEYDAHLGAAAHAGPGTAARRHRRLPRRVADRPAAARYLLRRLVAPLCRGRARTAPRRRRQGLAHVHLHARSRCRRGRADRARRRAAVHGATCRPHARPTPELTAPGPGRFLLPGDLAGSPLLTFFPLPPSANSSYRRGSLGAMLERRFESYKAHVVKPFFRDHFARLDRQIVLVDALSAVNGGPRALADLQRTIESILQCFRPGAHTWLSTILPRRIDRLLFAATKADHLHHTSHDRLEAILRLIADAAIARAAFAGAEVKVMALAALRATREAEAKLGRQKLPCIVGVPLPGERLAGKTFDGKAEAAVFPGDLPEDAASLLVAPGVAAPLAPDSVHFLKFRPPRVSLESSLGRGAGAAAHPARPRHRVPDRGPPHMSAEPRKPRVFDPADPAIVEEPAPRAEADLGVSPPPEGETQPTVRPTLADLGQRGLKWGTILAAALAGAAFLGLCAWFARLVSAALVRQDWVGTLTLALLLVAAFAALMLLLRELIGFSRLSRLGRLKAEIAKAIADRDMKRERKAALRLAGLYARRPEQAWSVRRFREHARDVHDPGELLGLADRDMMAPHRPRGAPAHHALGQARRHRHGAVADGADRGHLRADREPAAPAQARRALRRTARLLRPAAARPAGAHPHGRDRRRGPDRRPARPVPGPGPPAPPLAPPRRRRLQRRAHRPHRHRRHRGDPPPPLPGGPPPARPRGAGRGAEADVHAGQGVSLSSRCLSPGSIVPQAQALLDGWIPGTSPGMTVHRLPELPMFATFFHELKAAKVPVTLKEYLTLMEALEANLADRNIEHFYYLSRATLVKDERHLDKFDQVFGHVFKGLELMREAWRRRSPRSG